MEEIMLFDTLVRAQRTLEYFPPTGQFLWPIANSRGPKVYGLHQIEILPATKSVTVDHEFEIMNREHCGQKDRALGYPDAVVLQEKGSRVFHEFICKGQDLKIGFWNAVARFSGGDLRVPYMSLVTYSRQPEIIWNKLEDVIDESWRMLAFEKDFFAKMEGEDRMQSIVTRPPNRFHVN